MLDNCLENSAHTDSIKYVTFKIFNTTNIGMGKWVQKKCMYIPSSLART